MKKTADGYTWTGLISIISVALIAGAIAFFGAYKWQHNKVDSFNSKVTSLNNQVNSLNQQISSLSGQLKSACQTNAQQSQPGTSCTAYTYKSQKGATLLIFAPAKNSKLTSPAAVVGEIPGTWSFEAQFPVLLKDSKGDVIAQAPAQVLGNWMTDQLVPFSVQLTYPASQTGSGVLVLQKDNPSSLEKNSDFLSIPLRF